ncbi:MAG: acetyl-CoA carboxylase biotin carboxylase subunit family protein [Chitinispirillaceae bacterium]
MKQVFVIGLDDFNAQRLKKIKGAEEVKYHCLISHAEAHGKGFGSFEELRKVGEKRLSQSSVKPDAIISWWDYPSTCLAAWFKRKYDLPGASLESVLKCEHKYWSRCEQQKVIPDNIPFFQALNPFADDPLSELKLNFPFWIKPVKSVASRLAMSVNNEQEFHKVINRIRRKIYRYGGPFNEVLQHADLPQNIRNIDGLWCIVEEVISTEAQCTLSGYVYNGRVHLYGIVDSINYTHVPSFFRYEYPSRLPEKVKKRIRKLGATVMEQLGYDNQAFNIEFYYDRKRDHLWLLEVNPRISQSHAEIYKHVDGMSNLAIVLSLGLGRQPHMPHREGDAAVAAKGFFRHFSDGIVRKAPTKEEIEHVQQQVPGTIIFWDAPENTRLSEMVDQDSYSYSLGIIYLYADSREELMQKYIRVLEDLPYYIEDIW